MTEYMIDITEEHCPMTFVKIRLKLEELFPGDYLTIKLLKGEPLDNVPKTITEYGFNVISLTKETDSIYWLKVKKPC